MGLAISRTIVESHGGRLWGANNNGSGEFRFTLPPAEETKQFMNSAESQSSILSMTTLHFSGQFAIAEGHRICGEDLCVRAPTFYAAGPRRDGCLVADLQMPGMDGLELEAAA